MALYVATVLSLLAAPNASADLLVSSQGTNSVLRYDQTTGASLGTFTTGGALGAPNGLGFGPDGNLYVSSYTTDNVLRYNGTTGAFIDTFATGGSLSGPYGLGFGPDGNLYVSSNGTNNEKR